MLKFNEYFKDSYGWDNLSTFVLFVGIILLFSKFTIILGILLIIYIIYRTVSKDKYKRHEEEINFEKGLKKVNYYFYKLKQWFLNIKQRFIKKKKYVIISCPSCGQKLRLPRRKGKILVTCAVCKKEFKIKT